jgi:hypothetical protein
MGGSLIVGPYDLLDPTGPATLLGFAGTDFGAGTPDVTTVSRILLDGDVVAGTRTGNRLVKLVVLVHAEANNAQVIADLTNAVNQRSWSIPWTPDTGRPTVAFDAFRGSVTRDWDPYYEATTLTLLIPALPFTRDAVPITLGASAAAVVTVNSCDATTGLVTALPTTYLDGPGTNNVLTGLVPNVYAVDTTTHVSGSGSIKVTSPVYQTPFFTSSTSNPAVFHLVQGTFATVTDLSGMQTLAWSAMSDATMNASGGPSVGNFPVADPTQQEAGFVGIAYGSANQYTPPLQGGSWIVALIDSSGRRSRWDLTGQGVTTSWSGVAVSISAAATAVDAGFDITHVAGWRLRYTNLYLNSSPGSLPTLELLPASQFVGANPLNYSSGAAVAAGTAEVSTTPAAAVTAGASYAVAAPVGSYAGYAMQVGLEWLSSTGATISTTWSAVTTAPSNTGYPLTASGAAPAGAVTVRPRYRWIGAAAGQALAVSANNGNLTRAHLNAGTTCYSYPFGAVPAATLWVDNILAYPAGAGTPLTTSYALQTFLGIQGAARTPVSLSINAAGGATPKRVLVARTPSPAPGFTPFLDTPSASTFASTTDATALTGKYLTIRGGGTATVTYTIPAASYGSTYAVLARMKRTAVVPMTPTLTASLVGDSTITSVASRTFGTTGQDATTLPTSGAWVLVPLGVLTLPPRGVSGSNTAQMMTLVASMADANGSDLFLDLVVLVDLAGEMALVDAPTGNAWFWMDSPTSSAFTGTILAGSVPTRTDALAMSPYQSGQAVLNFDPGANSLTVLLDQSSSGGTVNLSYFPRWAGERPDHVAPPPPLPGGYPATYTATY